MNRFKYTAKVGNFLKAMLHPSNNIFEHLRFTDVMNRHDTFQTIDDISKHLKVSDLPQDILLLIWSHIPPEDRVIYGDEDVEFFVYDDIVVKGAKKYKKNKKSTLRVRKSVRYRLSSEFDDYVCEHRV